MENSRYRWVIVAAGGLLGCVAIGGMFSLPVFLQPIARDTGWSVTGVSSAMTIGFLAMAFSSMIWGTLSDRVGPLPVVLTGSVVLASSLGLASLATSLIAFQLVFGLMVGGAIAAIFAPMMATVTGMPLYAVLVRENFPLRMMGTVIGGTAMAGSLGMATGPLAGGLIYDTFASYAWLYIGSWIMGLGAFLIIMTFKPMPVARVAAPVPA